jgi:hypothetical protein
MISTRSERLATDFTDYADSWIVPSPRGVSLPKMSSAKSAQSVSKSFAVPRFSAAPREPQFPEPI